MREQVNLTGKYQCNEYFCAKVGITARMWYDEYPVENRQQNGNDPLVSYFTVYPSDAQAIFSYNKFNNIGLGLQVGYFPMTYDSCCRNLGDIYFAAIPIHRLSSPLLTRRFAGWPAFMRA